MSLTRTTLVLFLVATAALPTQSSRVAAQPPPSSYADRVAALLARGRVFEQRGDPTTALAFYRDAIAAGPRDARGYAALGFGYLSLSEWARAREVFEAGTTAAASDEDLWWGLAEAQRHLGSTNEALQALRAAVEINPTSVRALSALAELASELGVWTSALAATRALSSLTVADGNEAARLRLRARAFELILGSAERVRGEPCPASSAVLSALGRCR